MRPPWQLSFMRAYISQICIFVAISQNHQSFLSIFRKKFDIYEYFVTLTFVNEIFNTYSIFFLWLSENDFYHSLGLIFELPHLKLLFILCLAHSSLWSSILFFVLFLVFLTILLFSSFTTVGNFESKRIQTFRLYIIPRFSE